MHRTGRVNFFSKKNINGFLLTHYSLALLFYISSVFRGYRKATPGCNRLTTVFENRKKFSEISPDSSFPPNVYLFKFNNGNSMKRYEKCSKLTIKTPESYQ